MVYNPNLISRRLFRKIVSTRSNYFKNFTIRNVSRNSIQFIVPTNRKFATSIESSTSGAEIPANKQAPIKEAEFTADKYTYLRRNPNFKELTQDDIKFFASILPANGLIVDNEEELMPYNVDWMKKYRGKSRLVARPKTTHQVSKILKYCNENKLAVVPQGGNTGLVGGGVPVFDEIVINTNNMNQIRSFDPVSGILTCDAGCILEVLDNYLAEQGCIMPLDLGAKGSCHIGGNVATNAGGLRLLRYGSLHGNVLGLEAVLPDGTILDNLSTLRKDNTGYDLKQLFIGSEGTLGIITGVSILTPPRPKAVNVAVLGMNTFQDVQKAFVTSRNKLSEILSAFEFWDSASLKLLKAHNIQGTKFPLEDNYPFYVLVEISGSNKYHDDEKLQDFLEELLTNGIINDGVVAQDETQISTLWSIRESFPEACIKAGATYKYDISIPLSDFYKMAEDLRNRLQSAGVFGEDKLVSNVIAFGHVGDGNIHINVTAKSFNPEVTNLIEPFIYEWTERHNGSISAEHGLGLMKANYLRYSKSSSMISIMRQIKQSIDPNGIMNPYKFLPNQ